MASCLPAEGWQSEAKRQLSPLRSVEARNSDISEKWGRNQSVPSIPQKSRCRMLALIKGLLCDYIRYSVSQLCIECDWKHVITMILKKSGQLQKKNKNKKTSISLWMVKFCLDLHGHLQDSMKYVCKTLFKRVTRCRALGCRVGHTSWHRVHSICPSPGWTRKCARLTTFHVQESDNMWPSGSGFFHSAQCPQGSANVFVALTGTLFLSMAEYNIP